MTTSMAKLPSDLQERLCVAARDGPVGKKRALVNELHRAAHLGKVEAVRLLVALGCDLRARATGGLTPLHMAAGTWKR